MRGNPRDLEMQQADMDLQRTLDAWFADHSDMTEAETIAILSSVFGREIRRSADYLISVERQALAGNRQPPPSPAPRVPVPNK